VKVQRSKQWGRRMDREESQTTHLICVAISGVCEEKGRAAGRGLGEQTPSMNKKGTHNLGDGGHDPFCIILKRQGSPSSNRVPRADTLGDRITSGWGGPLAGSDHAIPVFLGQMEIILMSLIGVGCISRGCDASPALYLRSPLAGNFSLMCCAGLWLRNAHQYGTVLYCTYWHCTALYGVLIWSLSASARKTQRSGGQTRPAGQGREAAERRQKQAFSRDLVRISIHAVYDQRRGSCTNVSQ
jgi:hypothetical protein